MPSSVSWLNQNQIFATSLKNISRLAIFGCSLQPPTHTTKVAQGIYPPLKKYWCDDQDPVSWSALRLTRQHDAALLLHMGYAHHAFMAEPLGTGNVV